jgi:hypothetical protein
MAVEGLHKKRGLARLQHVLEAGQPGIYRESAGRQSFFFLLLGFMTLKMMAEI